MTISICREGAGKSAAIRDDIAQEWSSGKQPPFAYSTFPEPLNQLYIPLLISAAESRYFAPLFIFP